MNDYFHDGPQILSEAIGYLRQGFSVSNTCAILATHWPYPAHTYRKTVHKAQEAINGWKPKAKTPLPEKSEEYKVLVCDNLPRSNEYKSVMAEVSSHLKTVTDKLTVPDFMRKYRHKGSYRLILLYWLLSAPAQKVTENGREVTICRLTKAHIAAFLDLQLVKVPKHVNTPEGIKEGGHFFMNGTVSRHFKNFTAEGILVERDGLKGLYEINQEALLAAIAVEEAKFGEIDDGQPKDRKAYMRQYMRNRRGKNKQKKQWTC